MNFETITQNLMAGGFAVRCFATKAEAADYLNREIDGTSVGFGGSVTLEQMGLYEALASHNRVFWHHRLADGQTS